MDAGKSVHCVCCVVVRCERCGISCIFSSNNSNKECRKHGWQKYWSWKKLRFIWYCNLCVADVNLLNKKYHLK